MKFVGPHPLQGVVDPVDDDDAATKGYVASVIADLPGGGSFAATYRGIYNSGTAYTAGDLTTWQGSTYLAVTDTTGTDPTMEQSTPWTLISAGVHFTGPWHPDATYHLGDIVTASGTSYLGLGLIVAGTTLASGPYWAVLASGGDEGAPGPPGDAGPPGPAALGGYRHTQAVAATVWTITHALGFDPAGLTVISATGDTIDFPVVQYLTAGQSMRVSFDISLAGTAYLS